MITLNRRDFLYTLGAAATMAGTLLGVENAAPPKIKPISGSWFEFQHHATVEGVDWNPALANFTRDQWHLKIQEIAEHTGVSAGTVKSRLFYAVRSLEQLIPQEINLFVPERTPNQGS